MKMYVLYLLCMCVLIYNSEKFGKPLLALFITNQYEGLYFRSHNVLVIQLPSFSKQTTGIESIGFSHAGAALSTIEYHSKGHKQKYNIFWQSCGNFQGAFEITGYS